MASNGTNRGPCPGAAGVTQYPCNNSNFFPIAVWFAGVQQPSDSQSDQAAGLNTYVSIDANSNLAAVAPGMYVIAQQDEWGPGTPSSQTSQWSHINGWQTSDELDMTEGPPGAGTKGYTDQQNIIKSLPQNDGRLIFASYGKGVAFWESDANAAQWLNYGQAFTDDAYWFSDTDVCLASQGGNLFNGGSADLTPGQCHRASNYGALIDRVHYLETLDGNQAKPVWSVIEDGDPGTSGSTGNVTPTQVTAATWDSIVHGAQGIEYFNHSFAGPCISDNNLRDPCYASMRATITANNNEIQSLAPELNSPTVTPGATVVATTGGVPVHTMLKNVNGTDYLFAISEGDGSGSPTTATLSIPGAGNSAASVYNENRSVLVSNGQITDNFGPYQVHIYQIGAASPPPPPPPTALSVTQNPLSTGTAGSAYLTSLGASGGTSPYTWTTTGLPAGLTLSGNTISGTPTTPGTTNLTLTVTDSSTPPNTASATLPLTVNAAPPGPAPPPGADFSV
ncbi:MAG: putative Ig domain-containing protein, partial [Acidimicrobiales bacterium]